MNEVNKTLYIPLYGKAYVSKKGLFIQDKNAEEIWEKEKFPLKGKAKSKWLAYYMGIRSAVFDEWLKQRLQQEQNAVVIHIGCGMDGRAARINAPNLWYDVDFPEVIQERARYYPQTETYQALGCDVRETTWAEDIPKGETAIVVMEGVSMYLTLEECKGVICALEKRFQRLLWIVDCYTPLAAKLSKYKNPVKTVGVNKVYGVENPKLLQTQNCAFSKELEMTPKRYIQQLKSFEKVVFQTLYAGGLSKKLYKLYTYETK